MLDKLLEHLQTASTQPIGLVFAFLLGTVSAIASTCCTLPALGLVAGYSGTKVDSSAQTTSKALVKSALFFMLGTVISLMFIGAVSGFVGQVAQNTLGKYWKIFAGFIAVILGLATLKLLPFNISFGKFNLNKFEGSKFGAVITGIVLGGIVAVSSLPCNPGIFIVMGAAILQGAIAWAMLLLGSYAIGFSLPLGALILGISLGGLTLASKGMDKFLRWFSGGVLIVIGFYFLFSL